MTRPGTDELEAQCKRIAAWSMALEHASRAGPGTLEEILELAEALDAHFCWEPFQTSEEEPGELEKVALECLRVSGESELDSAIQRLPVFPLAAQRTLALLLSDRWSASQLEAAAGSDQALAAHLLQAANSWTHGLRRQIATLPHAVAYLGSDRAARVLYCAAIKPMFASVKLRRIWNHSLEAAHAAQALAEFSAAADPKQAFLAGLVHDIGSLAMAGLPEIFQGTFERLTGLGCEPLNAERVLSGFSHADAGARALRLWKFPEELREAVQFHHAPERSQGKLAALLYLTEHWTASEEDAPSRARLEMALDRTGLTLEKLEELECAPDRGIAGLRFGDA